LIPRERLLRGVGWPLWGAMPGRSRTRGIVESTI
jgi:hypothetical protein